MKTDLEKLRELEAAEAKSQEQINAAKELFKKVFDNPDGKQVLKVLKNYFHYDSPSFAIAFTKGGDAPLVAAYADGSKAIISLIENTIYE
tara:strand:+ start:246 stop:515 length:270 start_codon:yes stop_codon:yes gene_type:complete